MQSYFFVLSLSFGGGWSTGIFMQSYNFLWWQVQTYRMLDAHLFTLECLPAYFLIHKDGKLGLKLLPPFAKSLLVLFEVAVL